MSQKAQQDSCQENKSSMIDTNNEQIGCQDEEGPNESTTESKKNTNASSSGASDAKSEHYNGTDKAENEENEKIENEK